MVPEFEIPYFQNFRSLESFGVKSDLGISSCVGSSYNQIMLELSGLYLRKLKASQENTAQHFVR